LAGGLEKWDPPERYVLDLLTGDRSLDKRIRTAIAYVQFCQNFASSSKRRFLSDYPEIASALAYIPDCIPEEAAGRLYDLYRHAEDVFSTLNGTAQCRPIVEVRCQSAVFYDVL
jgi:hypothetical protein